MCLAMYQAYAITFGPHVSIHIHISKRTLCPDDGYLGAWGMIGRIALLGRADVSGF